MVIIIVLLALAVLTALAHSGVCWRRHQLHSRRFLGVSLDREGGFSLGIECFTGPVDFARREAFALRVTWGPYIARIVYERPLPAKRAQAVTRCRSRAIA